MSIKLDFGDTGLPDDPILHHAFDALVIAEQPNLRQQNLDNIVESVFRVKTFIDLNMPCTPQTLAAALLYLPYYMHGKSSFPTVPDDVKTLIEYAAKFKPQHPEAKKILMISALRELQKWNAYWENNPNRPDDEYSFGYGYGPWQSLDIAYRELKGFSHEHADVITPEASEKIRRVLQKAESIIAIKTPKPHDREMQTLEV